ncbi:MAG: alpha/beta fold hydrolase [Elusimicrobia bacterium]|nr:alpha/beta fold hydrolase [Elusimicrobiota bacterium]
MVKLSMSIIFPRLQCRPTAAILASALCLAARGARAQPDEAPGALRSAGFAEVLALAAQEAPAPPPARASAWRIDHFMYDTGVPFVGSVDIRAGYYEEAVGVPFRGNILYLEGLGDSMLNHEPLFSALSQAGWRVIAFDYMGQGGSGGTMNHTRILDPLFPSLQISKLADAVWSRYVRNDSLAGNQKIVLGWSTGGLAAYEMAHRGAADAVVLIAPGIVPKLIVGDRLKITESSLTRAVYARGDDPHVDAIRPDSPVEVPLFAANLLFTAELARHWKMSSGVRGLVLLSGPSDTYVDGAKTRAILSANAPRFDVVVYPDALHEIDNEVPAIREALTAQVLRFLDGRGR